MTGEVAGALRERVTIERRSGGRDNRAGATGSFLYDGAAWVSVAPIIPASLTEADALSALPRWQVMMRKREGIDLTTRLVWRGRFLSVRGVQSDPREPALLRLACQEVR